MKWLTLITASLNGMLLLSVLACGLWLHSQAVVEASSRSFHMGLGLAAVVGSSLVTILAVILVLKPA